MAGDGKVVVFMVQEARVSLRHHSQSSSGIRQMNAYVLALTA